MGLMPGRGRVCACKGVGRAGHNQGAPRLGPGGGWRAPGRRGKLGRAGHRGGSFTALVILAVTLLACHEGGKTAGLKAGQGHDSGWRRGEGAGQAIRSDFSAAAGFTAYTQAGGPHKAGQGKERALGRGLGQGRQ
jgi:hypothetical protein